MVTSTQALEGQSLPKSGRAVAVAQPSTWIAVPFGVFLAYDVARIAEVLPELDVPRLPLVLGLICLAVTAHRLATGGWRQFWDEALIVRAAVGLLALALITMPIGIWPVGSWRVINEKYLIQWLMFLMGAIWFTDRRVLRRSLIVFLLAVATAAYISATGSATEQRDVGRVYVARSLDPNDFGAILVTSIPLAMWLARTASPFGKLIWWCATVLMVAGLAPTASRGALLGVLGVAFVLIIIGTTGFRRFVLAGGIALGFVVFSAVVTDEQLARFGMIGGEDDYNTTDGEGRIAIWKRGIVWTIRRPTGYGMGNFPIYFEWLNGNGRAAHNSLVQIAVELGVAGLATFLFIYFVGIRDAWRYLRGLRGRAPPGSVARRESDLARLAIAMTVGTFITGFFLSNAYAPITMLTFAILAALRLGQVGSVAVPGKRAVPTTPLTIPLRGGRGVRGGGWAGAGVRTSVNPSQASHR